MVSMSAIYTLGYKMQHKNEHAELVNKKDTTFLHKLQKTVSRHALRIFTDFPKAKEKEKGITQGYLAKKDHITNHQHVIKYAKHSDSTSLHKVALKQFLGEVMSIRLAKILLTKKVPFNGINVDHSYGLNYHKYSVIQKTFGTNAAIRSEFMEDYRDLNTLLNSHHIPDKKQISGFATLIIANLALGNTDLFNLTNLGLSAKSDKDGLFVAKYLDFGNVANEWSSKLISLIPGKALFKEGYDLHKLLGFVSQDSHLSYTLLPYNLLDFKDATNYVINTMTPAVIDECVTHAITTLNHIKFDAKIFKVLAQAFKYILTLEQNLEYYNAIYKKYCEIKITKDILANLPNNSTKKLNDISITKFRNDLNFLKLTEIAYCFLHLNIAELEETKVLLKEGKEISLLTGLDDLLYKVLLISLENIYNKAQNPPITNKNTQEQVETYEEFSQRIAVESALLGLQYAKAFKANILCLKDFQQRLDIISEFDTIISDSSWVESKWLYEVNEVCALTYAWRKGITICGLEPWEYALANDLKFKGLDGSEIHPVMFYHYRILPKIQNHKQYFYTSSYYNTSSSIYDREQIDELIYNNKYYINGYTIIEKTLWAKNHLLTTKLQKLEIAINEIQKKCDSIALEIQNTEDSKVLLKLQHKQQELNYEMNNLTRQSLSYKPLDMLTLCLNSLGSFHQSTIISNMVIYIINSELPTLCLSHTKTLINSYCFIRNQLDQYENKTLQDSCLKLSQAHELKRSDIIPKHIEVNLKAVQEFAALLMKAKNNIQPGCSDLDSQQLQYLAKIFMLHIPLEDTYIFTKAVQARAKQDETFTTRISEMNGNVLQIIAEFLDLALSKGINIFTNSNKQNKSKDNATTFLETFVLNRKSKMNKEVCF